MAYVTHNTKYISYKTNEYKLLMPFMRSKKRECQTTRTILGMYFLRVEVLLSEECTEQVHSGYGEGAARGRIKTDHR